MIFTTPHLGVQQISAVLAPGGAQLISQPPVPSYDAAVASWIAAGGTATDTELAAADTMVRAWRTGGYFSKILTFVGFFGANLTSALIPLVGTAPTNNNFVSGDYSSATGLTGNGTTKYLDLNQEAPGPATGGIGFYGRGLVAGGGNRFFMGASNGTDTFRIAQTGTTAASCVYGKSAGASIAAQLPVGAHGANRSSGTRLDRYDNGVSVANSTTAVTPAAIGLNLYLFAVNVSGVASGHVAMAMGGYWTYATMTAAEELDFYNSVQAFQTALGRQV